MLVWSLYSLSLRNINYFCLVMYYTEIMAKYFLKQRTCMNMLLHVHHKDNGINGLFKQVQQADILHTSLFCQDFSENFVILCSVYSQKPERFTWTLHLQYKLIFKLLFQLKSSLSHFGVCGLHPNPINNQIFITKLKILEAL